MNLKNYNWLNKNPNIFHPLEQQEVIVTPACACFTHLLFLGRISVKKKKKEKFPAKK
jgi:hypothetical protein